MCLVIVSPRRRPKVARSWPTSTASGELPKRMPTSSAAPDTTKSLSSFIAISMQIFQYTRRNSASSILGRRKAKPSVVTRSFLALWVATNAFAHSAGGASISG